MAEEIGLFFFSSRRRHTRFTSDWSSDVCSSDLDLRINDTLEAKEIQTQVRQQIQEAFSQGLAVVGYKIEKQGVISVLGRLDQ